MEEERAWSRRARVAEDSLINVRRTPLFLLVGHPSMEHQRSTCATREQTVLSWLLALLEPMQPHCNHPGLSARLCRQLRYHRHLKRKFDVACGRRRDRLRNLLHPNAGSLYRCHYRRQLTSMVYELPQIDVDQFRRTSF